MNRRAIVISTSLLVAISTSVWSADRMLFWNLTGTTVTKLYLAPAGTTKWSPDQCANDKDGSVDPDERLKLTGIAAGRYDVKLTDKNGRTCFARDVALQTGAAYAFSLSEADLNDCSK
jgi:hypothetical protein